MPCLVLLGHLDVPSGSVSGAAVALPFRGLLGLLEDPFVDEPAIEAVMYAQTEVGEREWNGSSAC